MARKAKVVVESVELVEALAEQDGMTIQQAQDLVEVAQLVSSQPSLISQLVEQVVNQPEVIEEVVTKTEKNVGVGTFIKSLITEGLGNKEVLSIVHEQYGNTQTSYACVAWYRNKMKKTSAVVAKNSALDFVTRFAQMSGASEGEVKLVRSELRKVA